MENIISSETQKFNKFFTALFKEPGLTINTFEQTVTDYLQKVALRMYQGYIKEHDEKLLKNKKERRA